MPTCLPKFQIESTNLQGCHKSGTLQSCGFMGANRHCTTRRKRKRRRRTSCLRIDLLCTVCALARLPVLLYIGYYNKLRNISGNGNAAKCLGMGNEEKGKREKQATGNKVDSVGGRGPANWARPLLLVLCASKQNGSILFNKLTTGLFIGRKTMAMAMSWHLIGFLCNLLSHFLLNGVP